MNRLQAILVSLFIVGFVQYAGADAVMAAGHGCSGEREAIRSGFPAVAEAGSDSTGGYSQDPAGTGAAPESPGPADEMNRTDTPSGNEGTEGIGEQPPAGTGNLPETVEPKDESGPTGAPSDPTPGSSY